jgi:small subunit ribosomal protein S6
MKRKYELMFTVDALLDEGQVDENANKVRQMLESKGAEIEDWNRWGKRRFAYEIKGRTHGVYFVVTMTMEPNVVAEVEQLLKLNESVLRHLMIYITPRMEKLLAKQTDLRTKLSIETSERAAKMEGALSPERPQNLDEAEAVAEKLAAEDE